MKTVKKYQFVEMATPNNRYNEAGHQNLGKIYADRAQIEAAVLTARIKAKEMAGGITGMEAWSYWIKEIEVPVQDPVDVVMKNLDYTISNIFTRAEVKGVLGRLIEEGVISVSDNSDGN